MHPRKKVTFAKSPNSATGLTNSTVLNVRVNSREGLGPNLRDMSVVNSNGRGRSRLLMLFALGCWTRQTGK
jgi:hypothetical protein